MSVVSGLVVVKASTFTLEGVLAVELCFILILLLLVDNNVDIDARRHSYLP